jgi:ATP-dependent exoDNAse (exonuclease V) beta subunit
VCVSRGLHVSDDLQVRRVNGGDAWTQHDEAARGAAPADERARAPELTDEQEAAVARRRGSMLLAAGAGSGKTTVLVERYVRACVEDGLRPSEILAITFTERAAWELKERLRARMIELRRRDLARDVEAASIGTFHGFCASILRADALAAGLSPGFDVLDEGLAERLRFAAFAAALRGAMRAGGTRLVDLAAAYNVDRLRRMILGVHGGLRSAGQLRPRLPQAVESDEDPAAATALVLLDDLLVRFDDAYEQGKRARSALDFDDLELRALALLLERTDLRERWAERLRLLMVDELQDTNRRQLELLAALEHDNLFTVGDEWQSIYGFRNADVKIFREREALLARTGASLALRRNFRSVPAVIDVVNRVFSDRFGEGFRRLEAARDSGAATRAIELLICDRQGWELDETLQAELADGLPPAPVWRLAEARLLARRVAAIVARGAAAPGEIAVLLRATSDLPVYERALAAERLPTLATAGSFWDGLEVGDLLAYLRVLANPLDGVALYGSLASPLAGLSLDALALIGRSARTAERPMRLWDAIRDGILPELTDHDATCLAAFRERLLDGRRRAALTSISELLREAIARSGYEQSLEAGASSVAESQQRLANVRKLVRLAADFERSEGRDLRGFLDHVEHLRTSGGAAEPEAPAGDGDLDAVRLMSIHAAKGLEFRVVCVADLGRAPNRSEIPDLIVDGDRVGVRLVDLDDPTPRPAFDFEELLAERQDAAAEEEDRVLYVAMTRARDRLLLSGSASFARWPEAGRGCPPIAWLAPALVGDLGERLGWALAGADAGEQAGAEGEPTAGADAAAGARAEVGTRPEDIDGERFDAAGADAAIECLLATPARLREQLWDEEPPLASGPVQRSDGPVQRSEQSGEDAREMPRAVASAGASMPAGGRDVEPRRPLERGSLSYTVLAELERCGYRHYLERVLLLPEAAPVGDGRREMRPRGIGARARGEVAHGLLETIDFARGDRPADAEIAEVARVQLGLEPSREDGLHVARLLDGVLAAPLARRIAAARELRREAAFAFSIGVGEPPVSGVLDLIATEVDGTSLIVDYKSDAVGAEEDLELLVARRYGAQRLIYALAALRDGAGEVEVVHWFLQRPRKPVEARFSAADAGGLEAALRERVSAVRARGYAVSDRPHRSLCLTCPGRSTRLCSWGEEQMLRELDAEPSDAGRRDGSL